MRSLTLRATSFATRQDLAQFALLVTRGMAPQHALMFGDNGVGKWADPTWKPLGDPICALPAPLAVHNQVVLVRLPGSARGARCFVRDVSPVGVVDLNPAALVALGLDPDDDLKVEGATVEL